MTINIEHTRAVNYEIHVTRMDQIIVPGTTVTFEATEFAPVTGALQPGQDDIIASDSTIGFAPDDGKVHFFKVAVTLIDPSLTAPSVRNKYVREFDIASPTPKEP